MERRPRKRAASKATAVAVTLLVTVLAGGTDPAGAEIRPICFPVIEPVTYTRSFGDPRSGGRVHEGEDLMGQKMHRLLSAVDGVIVDVRGPGGSSTDHGVRIRGDDGYYYAYLHMNNDTPGTDDGSATWDQVFAPGVANGARVRAGQLLGYMGDSGNAEAAGPHLHFEIRQPAASVWQSVAIDPYDSLQAARRCAPVNSPTHPFTSMGGIVTADPDAASTAPSRFDTFARGADNQLWLRSFTGTALTDWTPLGGILRSGPAATAPGGSRLDVFARGADDALWQRTRIDSTWGDWQSLGGSLTSDPDAASRDGTITVAARGLDNAIWYRTFDGSTWTGWTPAGGQSRSGPAVVASGPSRLEVYARGLDDGLWRRTLDNGTWSGWEPLGGILSSDPDAAVTDGRVYVVARGGNQRIYALVPGGPGWAPVSIDPVASGPSIVSWGPNRLDVFIVSTDGGLYQTWSDGSTW